MVEWRKIRLGDSCVANKNSYSPKEGWGFVKGEERSGPVCLADYDHPEKNSFVAANQWTFIENSNKRPDVILFLNGSFR